MTDNSVYELLGMVSPRDTILDTLTAQAIENIKTTDSDFASKATHGDLKVTILKEDDYLYLGAINTRICEWLRLTGYCDGDEPSEFELRFFDHFKNASIGKLIQVDGEEIQLDELQSQITLTTLYTDQDIFATMQIELGQYIDNEAVVRGLLRELISAAMFTHCWLHEQYTTHQLEN